MAVRLYQALLLMVMMPALITLNRWNHGWTISPFELDVPDVTLQDGLWCFCSLKAMTLHQATWAMCGNQLISSHCLWNIWNNAVHGTQEDSYGRCRWKRRVKQDGKQKRGRCFSGQVRWTGWFPLRGVTESGRVLRRMRPGNKLWSLGLYWMVPLLWRNQILWS